MDGFDGQPLYEDKCHVDDMDRRFNGAYNREVVLQRQIGSLKNQLDSFRDTIERLQFHLGCLNKNGTYLEENVTKSQYCFIKAPFNWKNAKFQEAYGGQAPLKIEIRTFGYGIIQTLNWSSRTGIQTVLNRTARVRKIVFCQSMVCGMIFHVNTPST
uniref:Uncharacterized protein n=1 Tax=Magallana gigas TaxID=29159 RepID=A0A8W8NWJ6_MAGGI